MNLIDLPKLSYHLVCVCIDLYEDELDVIHTHLMEMTIRHATGASIRIELCPTRMEARAMARRISHENQELVGVCGVFPFKIHRRIEAACYVLWIFTESPYTLGLHPANEFVEPFDVSSEWLDLDVVRSPGVAVTHKAELYAQAELLP